MKNLVAFCLIFLCVSCATKQGFKQAIVEQSPVEADIREAVFHYQFKRNASGQQQRASAYFLIIGEQDGNPSDEFIRRFASHSPPVKPASRCWSSMRRGVVDKDTGRSGLIFSVGSIKWINDTEVEVSGGYYEAGLSSSGNIYFVKRRGGKWEVTGDKMLWIS